MPTLGLDNLAESLLGYWLKLTTVTRDMITIEPVSELPIMYQGQRIPYELERRSEYQNLYKIQNYNFSSVFGTRVQPQMSFPT